MLPRGTKLLRILFRQRLLGRTRGALTTEISCRLYTNAVVGCERRPLLDANRCSRSSTTPRSYTSKDYNKILAAPATKMSPKSCEQVECEAKKKSKGTDSENSTFGEVKRLNTEKSQEQLSVAKAPDLSLVPQTKQLEIKTSKGVLSITTTIEDSKINDVVFEKVKSTKKKPTKQPPIPPAAISAQAADASKEYGVEAAAAAAVAATVAEGGAKKQTTSMTEAEKAAIVAAKATLEVMAKADAQLSKIEEAVCIEVQHISDENLAATKPKPRRILVDCNRSSLERNFITPSRAMSDFLLKASELESLPKIKRRSPYEQEPPITVFWRRDVEAKAIEVWGSREELLRETLKREIERKKHQQNIFTVKRRLRDYRREIGCRTLHVDEEPGLRGKSGKVVLIAVGINAMNFVFKVCGWLFTGSHSMFAESIHSLADTINQLILAYGIHKSTQMADDAHPYGYSNMKYVSSLISGVGIFCVGTGLSLYHGITGLMNPMPLDNLFWAFFILGGSLVSEGATLLVAMNEVRRSAKLCNLSFKDYVLTGKDPCVNVVLTEDAAAVTSVAVAASCMGLTVLTGSPVYDAVGSLLVGGILGGVASFIIYTNVAALVGKSIAEDQLNKINAELESDVMIRAIHDVKGIDMGNCLVRYKAEMDFDGRELTRFYLDKQDLVELLRVIKSFQSIEELEQFLLKHGENIVDLMGGEIDRIEMKLRKKFPEIRHCDLEIL